MSWISTHKSLPQEKESVLTFDKYDNYKIDSLIKLPWKQNPIWLKSVESSDVTHWRKLPKEPKGAQ